MYKIIVGLIDSIKTIILGCQQLFNVFRRQRAEKITQEQQKIEQIKTDTTIENVVHDKNIDKLNQIAGFKG